MQFNSGYTDPSYLRSIRDGLISGNIQKDNAAALPYGLSGIYEQALPSSDHPPERQRFLEFFGVWALLKKEVSAEFVSSVLEGWTEAMVLDVITRNSKWFNVLAVGRYALYHERLRSFLHQRISENQFRAINDAIIASCRQALEEKKGDEWEFYALEHLSSHLLLPAMETGHCLDLKTLAYDTSHWNRQIEISKDFEWSRRMLGDMMLWASKFDDEEVIECALNQVDLHHLEQNDAPRIVELVKQNDIETALHRIEAFGGNDIEGIQRKFILYILCLMELTQSENEDQPFRKEAIEKLLNHLDENLPEDHSILNWSNIFSELLIFSICEKLLINNLDFESILKRTNKWSGEWLNFLTINDEENLILKYKINQKEKVFSELKNISHLLFYKENRNELSQSLDDNFIDFIIKNDRIENYSELLTNKINFFNARKLIFELISAFLDKNNYQAAYEVLDKLHPDFKDYGLIKFVDYHLNLNEAEIAEKYLEEIKDIVLKNEGLAEFCNFYIQKNDFDIVEKYLSKINYLRSGIEVLLKIVSTLYSNNEPGKGYMVLFQNLIPYVREYMKNQTDTLDFSIAFKEYIRVLKVVYENEKLFFKDEKNRLINMVSEKCTKEQSGRLFQKLSIFLFEIDEIEEAYKISDGNYRYQFANKKNKIVSAQFKFETYFHFIQIALKKMELNLACEILKKIPHESKFHQESLELIYIYNINEFEIYPENIDCTKILNDYLLIKCIDKIQDIEILINTLESFCYHPRYSMIIDNTLIKIIQSDKYDYLEKINMNSVKHETIIKILENKNLEIDFNKFHDNLKINTNDSIIDFFAVSGELKPIANISLKRLNAIKFSANLTYGSVQKQFLNTQDFESWMKFYLTYKNPELFNWKYGAEIMHYLLKNKYYDETISFAKRNNLLPKYIDICLDLDLQYLVFPALNELVILKSPDLFKFILEKYICLNDIDKYSELSELYFEECFSDIKRDGYELDYCFGIIKIHVDQISQIEGINLIDKIYTKISSYYASVGGTWEDIVSLSIICIQKITELNLPYDVDKFFSLGIASIPKVKDAETIPQYLKLLEASIDNNFPQITLGFLEEIPDLIRDNRDDYWVPDFLLKTAILAKKSGYTDISDSLSNEAFLRWLLFCLRNPKYIEFLHKGILVNLYTLGYSIKSEYAVDLLQSKIIKNSILREFVSISLAKEDLDSAIRLTQSKIANLYDIDEFDEIYENKNYRDTAFSAICKYYLGKDMPEDALNIASNIEDKNIREELNFDIAVYYLNNNMFETAYSILEPLGNSKYSDRICEWRGSRVAKKINDSSEFNFNDELGLITNYDHRAKWAEGFIRDISIGKIDKNLFKFIYFRFLNSSNLSAVFVQKLLINLIYINEEKFVTNLVSKYEIEEYFNIQNN